MKKFADGDFADKTCDIKNHFFVGKIADMPCDVIKYKN